MRGTAAAASDLSRSVVAATEVIGTGPGRVARGRVVNFVGNPSVASFRPPMVGENTLAISASIEPGSALVPGP